MEKRERLRELEIENDKQRKQIMRKIQKMEKKKIELDKKKDEFYQKIRENINSHLLGAKNNKSLIDKEDNEKRGDILDYENYKFSFALEKEEGNRTKRINSQNKTIANQKETESRLKEFNKIMSSLQDSAIATKTTKERRNMYNEKVRKEREEKRKEEEEQKLEKLGMI